MGEFVIQDYPPGSVSALDIENYIREIKMKKNIDIDAIVIDYLGIMKPINSSVKGLYERGKEVCENLRWLSYRFNCPVFSASQTNRAAYGEERVGMNDVSDSLGISMTADLMIGITHPPEMRDLPQLRVEIIKSRFSETGTSFILPVDRDKLKLLSENVTESEMKDAKIIRDLNEKRKQKQKQKDDEKQPKKESKKEQEESEELEESTEKPTKKPDNGRNSKGIKIR